MRHRSSNSTILAGIISAIALFVAPLSSANANSLDQIVTALLPETSDSRGLQRVESAQQSTIAQSSGRPKAKLMVSFDRDGHLLTVEGMRQLRTLAKALQDPRLSSSQFQIRAFAYTPNAPSSAQPVSSRRAQAVFEHLQGFYDIDIDKVVGVQGLGSTELNSSDPVDPLNQRIEIVNISVR